MIRSRRHTLTLILIVLACFAPLHARSIHWKGHHWAVTTGGMAGVAPGDPANVSIDRDGFLHLQIVKRHGKWTASELFTDDNLRFGTYQWVVEGDVYSMDKSTVLGLFPYGPEHNIGVDGENEIDIEFSRWDDTCGGCNADFTVYPAERTDFFPDPSWESDFYVSGGSLTTARMQWNSQSVVFTIMKGVQPIGTTAHVLQHAVYSSAAPMNIPQKALPVGINLWCFQKTPKKKQSVVIRDFQFVPR